MLIILAILGALACGGVVEATPIDLCQLWLDHVQPLAEDPYERLGFDGPVPLTEVTRRFRQLTAEYADHPSSLRHFADAVDEIQIAEATAVNSGTMRLSLAAQARAHGKIRGNFHSGRFTIGYAIDHHGSPTADQNVFIEDVLDAEPAASARRALPDDVVPEFEHLREYFAKMIARVGVEGGFDDVVALTARLATEARGDVILKRRRQIARDLFVELFAPAYVAALADPRAPEPARTRRILGKLNLPAAPTWRSVEERLEVEKDPRTFLRVTVHHFRTDPAALNGPTLARLAVYYERRFFADEAKFIQALLFFATDQWTDRDLRVDDRRDRALIQVLIERLVHQWIVLPTLGGERPRWFDLASVLWDAENLIAKRLYTPRPGPGKPSPFWTRLRLIEDEHPAVLDEVRAKRGAAAAPTKPLP